MGENGAIPIFALRKSGEKFCDPVAEVHRQTQNGAQLNHDGVHLPIAVGQAEVENRLGDTQVRGRTDWKKLRKAPMIPRTTDSK